MRGRTAQGLPGLARARQGWLSPAQGQGGARRRPGLFCKAASHSKSQCGANLSNQLISATEKSGGAGHWRGQQRHATLAWAGFCIAGQGQARTESSRRAMRAVPDAGHDAGRQHARRQPRCYGRPTAPLASRRPKAPQGTSRPGRGGADRRIQVTKGGLGINPSGRAGQGDRCESSNCSSNQRRPCRRPAGLARLARPLAELAWAGWPGVKERRS